MSFVMLYEIAWSSTMAWMILQYLRPVDRVVNYTGNLINRAVFGQSSLESEEIKLLRRQQYQIQLLQCQIMFLIAQQNNKNDDHEGTKGTKGTGGTTEDDDFVLL